MDTGQHLRGPDWLEEQHAPFQFLLESRQPDLQRPADYESQGAVSAGCRPFIFLRKSNNSLSASCHRGTREPPVISRRPNS
jgi:hypothetical protein